MDSVDRVLDEWRVQWPELDTAPSGIVLRLRRLAAHFERETDQLLGQFGLADGGFAVLSALRRAGPPYRLSPTELYRRLSLSSGAMTNRLDRLERAGYIQRHPDPNDRRAITASLTEQGKDLVERVAPLHLAREREMLSTLPPRDQQTLLDLLTRLLGAVEHS